MSEKNWKEQISPIQKTVLKISNIFGVIMFIVGVQFVVRGQNTIGQILSGTGMFIAVQMQWGINKIFAWLQNSKILERMGYSKLFWIVIIAAYILDCIGIGLIFNFIS